MDGILILDLHIKPADKYQYLHFTSSHPDQAKRSIIYSQTLRLSKICTFENDYICHKYDMKSLFLHGGYLDDSIETEMLQNSFTTRPNEIFKRVTRERNLIISLIKRCIYFIETNVKNEVKKLFSPRPWFPFVAQENWIVI